MTAPAVSAVVPVRNGMAFLPTTLPSLLAAARSAGDVEIVYADNGSVDGTLEYLRSVAAPEVRVVQVPVGTIAAVRNAGARAAHGRYLAFLDVDCSVPADYFRAAREVLAGTGASATGCETHVPPNPHWIESAWHEMHFQGRDREVHYLNSANFFVARPAFDAVGGFREELLTGEDSDIGQRLRRAGFTIWESTRLLAYHHGNPTSLREFWRRTVWHGLGMFATVDLRSVDKPTYMTALHLLASVAGAAWLLGGTGGPAVRLLGAAVPQLVVPAVTVAYRGLQTRRRPPLPAALLLYWLYYWARVRAAILVVGKRADRYRKAA